MAAPRRYRITVPADDQVTLAFLATQANPSASIRYIIHAFAVTHGIGDALSLKVDESVRRSVSSAHPTGRIQGQAAAALAEAPEDAEQPPAPKPEPKAEPAPKQKAPAARRASAASVPNLQPGAVVGGNPQSAIDAIDALKAMTDGLA
jgi:hypothetical protein